MRNVKLSDGYILIYGFWVLYTEYLFMHKKPEMKNPWKTHGKHYDAEKHVDGEESK